MVRIVLVLIWAIIEVTSFANPIEDLRSAIEGEQHRIDSLDGRIDNRLSLKSNSQSQKATQTYFEKLNYVVMHSAHFGADQSLKILKLQLIHSRLKRVDKDNYPIYNQDEKWIDLIHNCIQSKQEDKIEQALIAEPLLGMEVIPFFSSLYFAESYLIKVLHIHPRAVLKNFNYFDQMPYAEKVLIEALTYAPMKVKTYLSSRNEVQQLYRKITDERVAPFKALFAKYGSASNGYALLQSIKNKELTIDEAHFLPFDSSAYFTALQALSQQSNILARHSVDEALEQVSLRMVRVINDLHNETDAIRYKSIASLDAHGIYTLCVYTEDEMFTSTFLNMFGRMMNGMKEESSYAFLGEVKFNRFRTFIKMCAGFSVLDPFLAKMQGYEKELLFQRLCDDVHLSDDALSQAASIIMTYESLEDVELKSTIKQNVNKVTQRNLNDLQAQLIYEVLMDVMGRSDYASTQADITSVSYDLLFKGESNLQQHFFYDDEDGISSYASFIRTFNHPSWKITDFGLYVKIESKEGYKVNIYANKPKHEKKGQEAILKLFEASNRWPEIVVHRGHSYYAHIAISSITPSASIVFLGSCGGYNNINSVLDYSGSAHIISSKQIGTMVVNNALTFNICEELRMGLGISWPDLWKEVEEELKANTFAMNRMQEYIPPHRNLGALFIKAYKEKCKS